MSGSFEFVGWNACLHRLDSHLKEFWGMESEPMPTPREKFPLPEKLFSEDYQIHGTASSRTASPTHYQKIVLAPISLSQADTHLPFRFILQQLTA